MLFILCVQGSAVIIPTYDKDLSTVRVKPIDNGGVPIRYLISAPTMRVPEDVSETVNAYLAFRAVLQCGRYRIYTLDMPCTLIGDICDVN